MEPQRDTRARAHGGGTEDWRRPCRAPHRRQRPRTLAFVFALVLRLAPMPAVRIAAFFRVGDLRSLSESETSRELRTVVGPSKQGASVFRVRDLVGTVDSGGAQQARRMHDFFCWTKPVHIF